MVFLGKPSKVITCENWEKNKVNWLLLLFYSTFFGSLHTYTQALRTTATTTAKNGGMCVREFLGIGCVESCIRKCCSCAYVTILWGLTAILFFHPLDSRSMWYSFFCTLHTHPSTHTFVFSLAEYWIRMMSKSLTFISDVGCQLIVLSHHPTSSYSEKAVCAKQRAYRTNKHI